jgi:hypothetical protein
MSGCGVLQQLRFVTSILVNMRKLLRKIYHRIVERAVNKGRLKGECLALDEIRKATFSFSQLGEDLIIHHLTQHMLPGSGFYVDVGCYDPILLSNTFRLWKRGFRGINIDIDNDKIDAFNKARPDDLNVCAAISDGSFPVKVLSFKHAALNRVVPENAEELSSVSGEQPISVRHCQSQTLDYVVKKSTFFDQTCILLNIDCEGHDANVLAGANLDRLMPLLVCIEALDPVNQNRITEMLLNKGYRLIARLELSLIFRRSA